MLVALLTCILTKFLFGRFAKARGQKPCQKHTIRGLRPKLRRDWEHGNESKNFGIFKEISGFLGSSLGICTKLQLATLVGILVHNFSQLVYKIQCMIVSSQHKMCPLSL